MNTSDHLYQEKHSPHIPVFPFSLTTSKAPRWALYPNTHPWSHCPPQGISIVTHGTQQKQWCVTPVSVSQVILLGAACWKVVSSLSVRDKLYDHAPGVTSETDPPVPDRHTGEIVPDGGPESYTEPISIFRNYISKSLLFKSIKFWGNFLHTHKYVMCHLVHGAFYLCINMHTCLLFPSRRWLPCMITCPLLPLWFTDNCLDPISCPILAFERTSEVWY